MGQRLISSSIPPGRDYRMGLGRDVAYFQSTMSSEQVAVLSNRSTTLPITRPAVAGMPTAIAGKHE